VSYVLIDDYIPLKPYSTEFKYSKPSNWQNNSCEAGMWVPLLEKAYAKLLGGYSKIEASQSIFFNLKK
jgi:hypothetical protein